jgi:integrase
MSYHSAKSHLENHRGVWRCTMKVPVPLRVIVGKTKLVKSLGHVSEIPETVAVGMSYGVRQSFDAILEQAKAGVSIPEESSERIYTYYPARYGHSSGHAIGSGVRIVKWDPDEVFAADLKPMQGAPADKPVSFTEILAIWKLENDNVDTFKKFTRMMAALAKSTGTDDATKITPRQIVKFETSLRQADKLHPNTISNYMAAFNAVFTFAKRKFMIDVNPMVDVKVPGKVETNILPYTPEQVRLIVAEAQKLRIELYLCAIVQAYTGVRISEIANRKISEIRQEQGVWCLVIPSGKTPSSKRIIPLHQAVLKVLLPYRQSVIDQHGEGLLFPDLPGGSKGEPGAYATRELCKWIRDEKRGVGITDKKIQPNHSYRHYVKSQLYTAKVDVKTRDMICGHGTNVARKYEHGDIEQMLEAIQKLPNPLA